MIFVLTKQVGKSELKGPKLENKKRESLENVLTIVDGELKGTCKRLVVIQ